jgi:hypothetical protein
MPTEHIITAAVEGIVDEAVARKLVHHVGALSGDVYGKNGKRSLLQKIPGYNNAARHSPWIVVVDLDHDADCAPPFRANCLLDPAPFMCFRIAVREVEAWLLADRERIASFLQVPLKTVPVDPESLNNPKETVVNLARRSRSRNIREDLVPRLGSGRSIGPAYSSRLIEFAANQWRPNLAATQSSSLQRAIYCLKWLVGTCHGGKK